MTTVIKIENLWKEYRLGVIGHGTLTHDLQSWWARKRGKEDPNAKITPMLAGQEKQIDGDHFWALRDINLEVKQGEILGIIGKNGAGKSTLLKILSRVTAPTRGNIKVKGRIASLLEVGTGFHPELTGRENIFMNGAILGMSKQEIKNKLDEIIDFSGVEDFVDTPVKRYSSGMYVRLAFAVAAHLEPEILVVDEVLAVGDAEFQKKCLGKMQDVSNEGRTVLFVSHNMGAVKSMCSKCAFLRNGQVSLVGTVEEALRSYTVKDMKIKRYIEYDTVNSVAQFTSIELLSETTDDGSITNVEKIVIELTYEVKRKCQAFYIGMNVYNEFDEPVTFWRDFELLGDVGGWRQEGIYKYNIKIPGQLLAPGTYRFNVGMVETEKMSHIHMPQESLGFKISVEKIKQHLKGGKFVWRGLTAIPYEIDIV